MKYRKKPVVIDAVQLNWKNWSGDVCDLLLSVFGPGKYPLAESTEFYSDQCGEVGPFIQLTIPTLEGDMIARHGDWLIKGVKGELYPVKPDIFSETYELDE